MTYKSHKPSSPSPSPPQELRNFSYFEETMGKLRLTAGALCLACGYGKSSHTDWRKKGKIPTPLALACECLLRRQKKEVGAPAAQVMYVLLAPQKEAQRFQSLCEVFGAHILATITPPK